MADARPSQIAPRLGTILNVNDHEQTRYLVSRMLRMAGYHVLEAATGEQTLRLLAAKPDLIVLDVKLPDVSGFEICRMVKGSPETSSILVLQTSATYVTVDKKVEGLESGADAYLTHPFEPAELIATVRALLRLRHVEQELRHRADELADASRRKDEFLAMLAHELRNPLAGIVTALPLLRAHHDDPPKLEQLYGVIDRQTKHLSRLIDDLLDVARVTRGKISLRRRRVDLNDLLSEAIRTVRPSFEGRGQKLVHHVCPMALPLDGDDARLFQVFVNLLDNASKYSERGGHITVECHVMEEGPSRRVSVVVADEGIGIAPHVLPHIFELFVQADESLERTRGGMGIGLTLVKKLVELHGGVVTASSDGLGRGSRFEVVLPLAAARDARAGDGVGPTPTLPRRREQRPTLRVERRVLIVEDNADARETLQALLEVAGHTVEAVADGASGVDKAIAGDHDLAIVDIGLPGLNGYEVAEQIRARLDGTRRLRLVALTGYGGEEQRQRALRAGFDVHLVKPIDPDVLLKLIAEE